MSIEDYFQEKNLSSVTAARYLKEIGYYQSYLTTQGQDPAQGQKKHLMAYLTHLDKTRNMARHSKQQILCAIRHYHTHLERTTGLPNPTHLIHIRGAKQHQLRPLLTEEQLTQTPRTLPPPHTTTAHLPRAAK